MSSTDPDWAPRFEGHPRVASGALVLLAGLIGWGLAAGSSIPKSARSDDLTKTDSAMYAAIVHRMQDGMGYYQAVAIEQPKRGFPTSPAMNVREPTLAWFNATFGHAVAGTLLLLLAAAAALISVWVFAKTERTRVSWVSASCLASIGVGIFAFPGGVDVHEVWLSLIVYLGLLCRGTGLTRTSVLLILLAALVRELAIPLMMLLFGLAVLGRRWREAGWWAGALAAFGVFYGIHLWHVHEFVTGPSLPSPSWLAVGGWPFVVDAVRASSLLTILPFGVAAVIVPLGVLGWVSRRGQLFDLVGAFLVSYAALFCFVGRSNNAYWGTFLGTFILPGAAFGIEFLWSVLGSNRGQFWRSATRFGVEVVPSTQGEPRESNHEESTLP